MTDSVFIDISSLNYSYNKKNPAVQDLSLFVANEKFVAIIGPNGSGKTTLMKLLAGILQPDSGTLNVLGNPIMKKTDPSQILSYVPQTLSFGFSLSVLDFILLGISSPGSLPGSSLFGKVSREHIEKARKALSLLHMESYESRDMLKLSGGERQKIILTKALAQDTAVILLDEPITHLDLSGQIEILDLLKKLSLYEGKRIIAIMHDVNLAARYSDYTIILKNGKLFAADKTPGAITEENILKCFSVQVEKAGDFFVPVKKF